MTRTASQLQPQVNPVPRYRGHVTYIYAFDIAYEMARAPLKTLLGQPVEQFQVDASKRAPRQLFFYRPQMVKLPPLERTGPEGAIAIERQVKIYSVGAVTITLRVPFDVADIGELVKYHDLKFSGGGTIHDEVLSLARELRRELEPHLIRPVEQLADEEAYTVFCITSSLETRPGAGEVGNAHVAAEDWLEANRRPVAALLTEEYDVSHLSDQEAEESTSRCLSYYDHDLVVVDWDAALIIDEPRYIEEMVYLMELANLQLAELEAHDRLLDEVIDRAYRDLSRVHSLRSGSSATGAGNKGGAARRWTAARTLKDLREIRMDLAKLSDELSNITKFFGDWHLARIYQALSSRFHLGDWHKTTDEKLKTLDDLYQILQTDRNNRYMLLLEVTIVLLFVIDLLMLFRSGHP